MFFRDFCGVATAGAVGLRSEATAVGALVWEGQNIDYVNKESKDIFYTTYNIGVHQDGWEFGVSVKDKDKLASLGYNKKLKQDDLEYNVGLSFKSDLGENNIINLKSEIKKWLTEKINVFGLYKHEYYNKQEDFQFKVGLGVKL